MQFIIETWIISCLITIVTANNLSSVSTDHNGIKIEEVHELINTDHYSEVTVKGNTSKDLKAGYALDNPIECPELCTCDHVSESVMQLYCQPNYNDQQLASYFKTNPQITNVTFQGSNLTTIPSSLCQLHMLLSLDLAFNQIESIPKYPAPCFQKIEVVSFMQNRLTELDEETFEGFKALTVINLDSNLITSLHRLTFLHPDLTHLTHVHLQNNRMEYIDTWMFRMPAFKRGFHSRVNVSSNYIHILQNTLNFSISEIHLSEAIVIDFRSNRIRRLDDVQIFFNINSFTYLLGAWNCGFYFHVNPLDCDCAMYKLLNILRPYVPLFKLFGDLYLIQLHCESPPEAQGHLIYDLPDDVFRCYVNESCPQGTDCIHTPGNSTMTIRNTDLKVTGLPHAVPVETYIQLFFPLTRVHTLSEREYLSNVTTLDLANTKLSYITAAASQQLAQQVRHINFRESKLSVLPEAFTSGNSPHLQSIDITGNPFQCDCHMPHMREWLIRNSKAIVDVNLIQCSNIPFRGKPIIDIPEKYLLCGYIYIFIAFSSIILLVIILIIWLCLSAMRRRIMLRLIKFFNKNFTLGANPTERQLKYHITIFVAEEDQDKVDDICMAVQNPDDNLTVHRLGYIIGLSKLDITDKLPLSEGCLFFLSSGAVQDNHCIFCFRFAVDQFIRHYHRMFLIPVLLDSKETLIRNSKIPKDTKLFLQLFDYVDMSNGNTENISQLLYEMRRIMKMQVEGFPHSLAADNCIEQEVDVRIDVDGRSNPNYQEESAYTTPQHGDNATVSTINDDDDEDARLPAC